MSAHSTYMLAQFAMLMVVPAIAADEFWHHINLEQAPRCIRVKVNWEQVFTRRNYHRNHEARDILVS